MGPREFERPPRASGKAVRERIPAKLETLLEGPLRPIRDLITWAGKFFDWLAIALATAELLLGTLKEAGVAPCATMNWSRALASLWVGVPITLGVAVAVAVARVGGGLALRLMRADSRVLGSGVLGVRDSVPLAAYVFECRRTVEISLNLRREPEAYGLHVGHGQLMLRAIR